MKVNNLLLIFILFVLYQPAMAQIGFGSVGTMEVAGDDPFECPDSTFFRLLEEANSIADVGEYDAALKKCYSAKACKEDRDSVVNEQIDRIFQMILAERDRADSAFKKADKLVNAFYFYADRFALAFKDNEFYFIDTEGDEVAKLGRWDKAEHFIYSDYAKVRKMENGVLFDYLLDTMGNTFLTSSNLALMSWSQQKKIRRRQGLGETIEGELMALYWDKNAVRSQKFLLSIVYNGYSLEQLPENIRLARH